MTKLQKTIEEQNDLISARDLLITDIRTTNNEKELWVRVKTSTKTVAVEMFESPDGNTLDQIIRQRDKALLTAFYEELKMEKKVQKVPYIISEETWSAESVGHNRCVDNQNKRFNKLMKQV